MAWIIFSTIFFFLSVRTPVASMVTTACRRGRSRRRLAILSDGNAAGLVHSSKFSCKSSNLRRFEVLFTLRSKTRQRLGCHNAHLRIRGYAEHCSTSRAPARWPLPCFANVHAGTASRSRWATSSSRRLHGRRVRCLVNRGGLRRGTADHPVSYWQ